MLQRLLSAFRANEPEPLPQPDSQLALGALLVRVAKADHSYRVEEIQRIDRLLARLFGLNPVDAAKMRATCEKLDQQAEGIDGFAQLIRASVDHEMRVAAVQSFYEVMISDGRVVNEEITLINSLSDALGVSDSESNDALKKAEQTSTQR